MLPCKSGDAMKRQKKRVRAGIVGSRFAAKFHYQAIERVFGTEPDVVGVASRTRDSAEAFAKPLGLTVFDDLDSLLDQVDVVHVCTPPVTHEAVAVAALSRGVWPIVEKPFTGFFGDGSDGFDGRGYPKQQALDAAMGSVRRILEAEAKSTAKVLYSENWIYAPSVQKERDIIEKTGAQILWMHGEQGHSGSHSPAYGYWKFAGGGSMVGKGCHPLSAVLYLKRVEGRVRNGKPIRPATISARIHELTRLPGYQDAGHLRTDYHDIEDVAMLHVTFEDGTLATVFASEIIMGGIKNRLEVIANNHRAVCNINPNNSMQTYNPVEEVFKDVYLVEKLGTKQGWAPTAPDEDHLNGFPQEIEAFYRSVAYGDPVESDSELAADTIATVYAGYVSAEAAGAETKIPRT